MTFDKSNLPNLKIRVNNPEESKRAQEAFFALGGHWKGDNEKRFLFIEEPALTLNKTSNGLEIYAMLFASDFKSHENQEISLPELEALATKHKYQSLEFVDMNKVFLGRNTSLASQDQGEGLNSFETMMEESEAQNLLLKFQAWQLENGYLDKGKIENGMVAKFLLDDSKESKISKKLSELAEQLKMGAVKSLRLDNFGQANDPFLIIGERKFTRSQFAYEIEQETQIGVDCLVNFISLAIHMIERDHDRAELKTEAQKRYDAAIISFDNDFYDRIGDSDMEQIISSLKIAAGLTKNE